jgi:FkbM family methyltransferase
MFNLLRIRHQLDIIYWKFIQGDNNLRINYPLDKNSIVFDIGGYQGDWSYKIYQKYQSNIYIFEPVPEYYQKIIKRFKFKSKIHCFKSGLSDKFVTTCLHISDDSSSEFGTNRKVVKIKLREISDFLNKYRIDHIDLIKINIEGGEYKLLEDLIKLKLLDKICHIQIQFHTNIPDFETRRNKIHDYLKKNHHPTFNYPYVWESWSLNSNTI